MKLYTEEQIKAAYNMGYIDAQVNHINDADQYTAALIAIQLPSDEEISTYVVSTGYYGHCTQEYHEGIEEGAKWYRDKIQGGDK